MCNDADRMKSRIIFILAICLSFSLCASAQRKLERARQKDPKYHYNMGLFYLNQENAGLASIDQAIRSFDRALSLNPRFYLALNARGLAYSMKGDLQESLRSYQRCLDVNPNFTEARNNMGTIYLGMGFFDQAEVEFTTAAADENYDSRELPYYNLARLSFTRENYEKAFDFVQRSLRANNRLPMAHNLKGLILEKLDRLSEAIDCYQQALKYVPGEENFSFNLASAFFKNQEYSKAQELLEKLLVSTTDNEMKVKVDELLKAIKQK